MTTFCFFSFHCQMFNWIKLRELGVSFHVSSPSYQTLDSLEIRSKLLVWESWCEDFEEATQTALRVWLWMSEREITELMVQIQWRKQWRALISISCQRTGKSWGKTQTSPTLMKSVLIQPGFFSSRSDNKVAAVRSACADFLRPWKCLIALQNAPHPSQYHAERY